MQEKYYPHYHTHDEVLVTGIPLYIQFVRVVTYTLE